MGKNTDTDKGFSLIELIIAIAILIILTGLLAPQFMKYIEKSRKAVCMNNVDVVISEYQVERIVLGYPKNMNNTIGERAQKSLEFKEMLERRTGLPVIMWDERLTTLEAERTLIESKVRREDRKKYVDKIAAVFILQGYLDSIRMNHE